MYIELHNQLFNFWADSSQFDKYKGEKKLLERRYWFSTVSILPIPYFTVIVRKEKDV